MSKKRNALLGSMDYLRPGQRLNEGWTEENVRSREWEDVYRNRWQHDREVRSTHGVNCTGSCSWKIHVKNGIVTWETQQTDYPSLGDNSPEYEPRGCPRGASYSWYLYSPGRVKYPYVRAELLDAWQSIRKHEANPLAAWKQLTNDPEIRKAYQKVRGKGGFVRADWDTISDLIAAAMLQTAKSYGPDRVLGFSPIPAMSQVSFAAGSRFLSLMGGTMVSFYDWYADLPPASPQIWGEQTDVPESADWFNTSYFIIWGTNLPMTRTPDAHFMVEARYNGTKVVGVSPDYAEYIKFADVWLPCKAGTDAALAMAMTHVILKEFYVDHPTPYFLEYAKTYTDLPFLVTITPHGEGWVADRFLNANDVDPTVPEAKWKTLIWDESSDAPQIPNGSLGYRWDGQQKWNLHMKDPQGEPLNPRLSFLEFKDSILSVSFPNLAAGTVEPIVRGVPARRITTAHGDSMWVSTVYDLMMAHMGISRGLVGDYPVDYDDMVPYTPAWQEAITGVDRHLAIRIAREFAENAAKTEGRSMIALGAGTNHWYHSDLIYRTIINLVLLTGSQGVNGGGWAHYVGQEKVRPIEGWSTLAFGLDWNRPPRQHAGTAFFYFATDQFRYEEPVPKLPGVPQSGQYRDAHPADMAALASRLGWLPAYPQWTENSLDVVKEARNTGADTKEAIIDHVVQRISQGNLEWAVEHPDDPRNFPRVLFVWRSNLLGASGKGHEYFLKHMLGAPGHVLGNPSESWQPDTVEVTESIPEGKCDLLINVDFRMTSSGLYSDIVLPAATWYEKHDLSSTDMHPFIHPFNPAVDPLWESKTDWDTFRTLAEHFSAMAQQYLPEVEDLVMAPMQHDSLGEIAQPEGKVRDWRRGECVPIAGKTLPNLVLVHRDYAHLIDQMTSLGPLAEEALTTKGIRIDGRAATQELLNRVGPSTREGPGLGRPSLWTGKNVAEAILTLSGPSNGHRAVEEWQALEKTTGLSLMSAIHGREDTAYRFSDLTAQPRLALAAPVWSGLEGEDRRYSPFTANVDLKIPWRTITGRQHFYLDHDVMRDFGESLPIYRAPNEYAPFAPGDKMGPGSDTSKAVTVRYLTPHQKWGIHSTYTDTPRMLTLFRGGQTVWMSVQDAAAIGIHDNDWIEVFNRNGAIVARAVISHRIPQGVAMMYHAQDRIIGVPKSEVTGDRGGTHNSVTRIIPKATHMIGGYGQLSYSMNYYGPTGHQRDVMTWIRPLKEVDWLED